MKEGSRWSGAASLTVIRVATFVVGAASTVVFARLLGPAKYGVYASAAAVLAVVALFGNLGVDQLFLRSELDAEELRSRARQVAIISSALALAVGVLWPGLGVDSRVCFVALALAGAADDLKLPYLLVPQRELEFSRRGSREMLLQSFPTTIALVAVVLLRSPIGISVATMLGSALAVVPAKRALGGLWSKAAPGLGRTLRKSLPYAAAGALYTAYFQIDGALLASLRSPKEVGYYAVAYGVVFATIVVPVVLNGDIMLPQFYATDRTGIQARRILWRFAMLSIVCGMMALAAVELLGPGIIRLLFGTRYRAAIALLRILGFALVPHFVNSWAGNSLVGRARIRLVLVVQGCLLAVNLVGNILVIPVYGARGAAWMTVCTEVFGTVLYVGTLVGVGRFHGRRGAADAEAGS